MQYGLYAQIIKIFVYFDNRRRKCNAQELNIQSLQSSNSINNIKTFLFDYCQIKYVFRVL